MEQLIGSGDIVEYSNCSLAYDSTNFKILAGLRASTGFVSFLCCIAVIFLIIIFKKYKFFSQRLILNVAVAAMIHSLSYTTSRVNYYTLRPIDDPYCYFGGLFNHYFAAVELISIWCTTINIFSIGMCKTSISKFEALCYVCTYALPLLWYWVPLWLGIFGTAGGWCEVKVLDADCKPFKIGVYIQFGIWFIPLYVSTALILAMLLAVAIKSLCTIRRWEGGKYDITGASKKALCNEIRPLIVYPILYLLLSTFSFATQIYRAISPDSPSVVLPYFRVLTSPLRGAFIALAFALDKDTRKRLTIAHFKTAYLEWMHSDARVELLESTTIYAEREEERDTRYVQFKKVDANAV